MTTDDQHLTTTRRLAALVATATLLAGCGGGDGDEPPANAGGAATPGETTSGTPTETSAPPHWLDGVDPATGERVHNGAFSMHVPEDFTEALSPSSGPVYHGPGVTSITVVVFAGEPRPLREVRAWVLRDNKPDFIGEPRPRPDVEVDGTSMIRYGARSSDARIELFATNHEGYDVIIEFAAFHQDTDLEAVYTSTLASLEWK